MIIPYSGPTHGCEPVERRTVAPSYYSPSLGFGSDKLERITELMSVCQLDITNCTGLKTISMIELVVERTADPIRSGS